MPSKILAALSPAYGAIKGVGPFSKISAIGRHQSNKNKIAEEEEERLKEKREELEAMKRNIESSSYFAGGRVTKKPIDGKAVRGKTKGRII